MVATRQRPAQNVRDTALRAATRLFATHGVGATSLQQIADDIGVTKQAILHHFPSKERLRDAVLEAMLAHWQERLPRLLAAATASEDRFDAVVDEVMRFFADDPDRARLIVREALDRPHEVAQLLRSTVHGWLRVIGGYIHEGQEHGRHFADVDPEAYVVHIMYLVITAAASTTVTQAALEPGPAGRARLDRELVRIAKSALFVPRPPRAPARDASDKQQRRRR
jgi:AcrR family transcriptional regulator